MKNAELFRLYDGGLDLGQNKADDREVIRFDDLQGELLGGVVLAVDKFMQGFDGVLLVFHHGDAGAVDGVILPVAVNRNPEFRND